MGYKLMRRIEQPYMENGVEVHYPGELLEMDAPVELGGRVVIVEADDPPAAKPEPKPAAVKSGK